MKHITRCALPTIMLLWLFSNGMTSAVAGNNLHILPDQRFQPTIKVAPGKTQSYHYRAETRARSKKQGKVQAGGLAWQCQGNACTISGPWPTPAVGACQALARQVGPMRSYGHAGKKLSARQLKQCNAGLGGKSPAVAAGVPGLNTGLPGGHIGLNPALQSPQTRPLPAPVAVNKGQLVSPLAGKRVQTFASSPVSGTAQPVMHKGGFVPQAQFKSPGVGRNTPVTGPGGKVLLPSQLNPGSLHTLEDRPAIPRGGLAQPLTLENSRIDAAQLKLTIDHVELAGGYRVPSFQNPAIVPNDNVTVFFKIQNSGTVAGKTYVAKDLSQRTSSISVAPGQTEIVRLAMIARYRDRSPVDKYVWQPAFKLMDADTNREYRDASPDNNVIKAYVAFDLASGDISVEEIKVGKISMSTNVSDSFYGVQRIPWISEAWQGTGFYTPKMLTLLVKVKNHDSKDSVPQQLTVLVRGLAEYVSPRVRSSRHYPERYSKTFNCSGAGCPLRVTVAVPSLGANTSRDIQVTFADVGYKLWVNDKAGDDGAKGKAHTIRPGGYYMCKDNVRATSLARVQVTATLDTHGDAMPVNNGLRRSFDVGTWAGNGCELYPTGRAEAFIP